MRIAGLRVRNWMRFLGTHELDLGPGVYAVVAQHQDDPGRSNWLCKSGLLAAIRFALFGTVPTDTIDQAISRGTDKLDVDLETDDGMFIARSRAMGVSKKVLKVIVPGLDGGEREFNGDDAQVAINERLGIDEDDFLATSFFEQKEMSRFVKIKPADRTAIVNGWLKLERLERACRFASDDLAAAGREVTGYQESLCRLTERRTMLGNATDQRALEQQLVGMLSEAEEANRVREASVVAHARWEQDCARVQLREKLSADLRQAIEDRQQLPEPPVLDPLVQEVQEAHGHLMAANTEMKRAAAVARGEFDGVCPVAGIQCPAQGQINQDRKQARAQLDERRKTTDQARVKLDTAEAALREAQQQVERMRSANARVNGLTQRIGDEECGIPGREPVVLKASPVSETVSKLAMVRTTLGEIERNAQEQQELKDKVGLVERRLALLRVATVVLGRRGAQRVLADRACQAFEHGANERLARAGIDLRVKLVWGRPTQSLEEACGVCGEAYPSSAKVKECPKCGAQRGLKSDEKLHVDLSDRSGAAEDLAGIALQLAAAAWLRSRRGAAWSVLVLDEPFGSLDSTNRRALAASLNTLLLDGFDQAFIVAHSPDILDALPHRVEISADDKWSKVTAA